MQIKPLRKSHIAFFFSLSVVLILIGLYAIEERTKDLKQERYKEIALKMQEELSTLIEAKKDAMLLVAQTLALDKTLHLALEQNRSEDIDMQNFVQTLIEKTSLEHIQFHIVTKDLKSFYRSWSKKRGDDLTKVRPDLIEFLKNKQSLSLISVGIFDITFKSIVAIYYEGQFLGVVEAISKTNSIVTQMKKRGYKSIVVVDKSYKKQLFYPFTQHFINEYYIATLHPDSNALEILQTQTLETLLHNTNYKILEDKGVLTTSFQLFDVLDQPMAYIVIFTPLEAIDLSAIERDHNTITLAFFALFLSTGGIFLYLYIKRHNRLIQKMNKQLEQKVAQKTRSLQYLAHHDTLTNLPNRLLFLDRLEQALFHAKNHQSSLYVLFLDLDRFKEINDSFGHETGDKLLIALSKRLISCVREEDTVARLGGDEFTILLTDIKQADVVEILRNILSSMQELFVIDETALYSTFSIGISSFPQDGNKADILIRNADTAMYRAKELGKNRYQFYDEQMTQKTIQRLSLENKLRLAIQEEDLYPYFQVQTDTETSQIVGVEALVRWIDKSGEVISPALFISLAEELGIIAKIDEVMMRKSLLVIKELQKEKLFDTTLSLNLSVKQLEHKNFLTNLQNLLEELEFDPKHLELEVTESQIMKQPKETIDILQKLRNLGISIAIDDFGTGYSSLSYLKKLPLNKLKIDQSFVQDLPYEVEDVAIVEAIIALAKSLDLELIAEGVETAQQKDFLLQKGCRCVQGYYYSKPLDTKAFKEYLKQQKSK